MLSLATPLRSLVIGLLLGYPLALHAQSQNSACLIAERFQQTYTVREQAVSINTEVRSNTTFYPIPEGAVTITNAPTSIDTITTFRWTEAQVPMSIWAPTIPASTSASLSSMAYSTAMQTGMADLGDYYVIAAMGARNVQKRQGNGAVRDAHPGIRKKAVRSVTNRLKTSPTSMATERYRTTAQPHQSTRSRAAVLAPSSTMLDTSIRRAQVSTMRYSFLQHHQEMSRRRSRWHLVVDSSG